MKLSLLKAVLDHISDGIEVVKIQDLEPDDIFWYEIRGIDDDTNTTYKITVDAEHIELLGLKDKVWKTEDVAGNVLWTKDRG